MAVLAIGLLLCKGSLAKKGLILHDSLMSWINEDGLCPNEIDDKYQINGVPMRKKQNKRVEDNEDIINSKLPPLILLIECILEFAVIQSTHYQQLQEQ